jgi:hypothetical protein
MSGLPLPRARYQAPLAALKTRANPTLVTTIMSGHYGGPTSPAALTVDTTFPGLQIIDKSQNSPTSSTASTSTLTAGQAVAQDAALEFPLSPGDAAGTRVCVPDEELSLLDVTAALARRARECEERIVSVFVADNMARLTQFCPGLVVDGECILSYVDDVADVLAAEGQTDMIPMLHEAANRAGVSSEVRAFLSRWRLSLIETLGTADVSDFDRLLRCFLHDVREHAAVEHLAAIHKQVVRDSARGTVTRG